MTEGIIQKVFEPYFSDSDNPFENTISIAEMNGYLDNLQQELIAEIKNVNHDGSTNDLLKELIGDTE